MYIGDYINSICESSLHFILYVYFLLMWIRRFFLELNTFEMICEAVHIDFVLDIRD